MGTVEALVTELVVGFKDYGLASWAEDDELVPTLSLLAPESSVLYRELLGLLRDLFLFLLR